MAWFGESKRVAVLNVSAPNHSAVARVFFAFARFVSLNVELEGLPKTNTSFGFVFASLYAFASNIVLGDVKKASSIRKTCHPPAAAAFAAASFHIFSHSSWKWRGCPFFIVRKSR